MLIRAWKTENKKVYSDFVRRIEAVKKGDMSIITEMMDVAKNCVPEEVRVFHNWLGDVLNGKVKMADITQSIQGLSIEHIHMIAKCLVYKEQWMAIDMKTGEAAEIRTDRQDFGKFHGLVPTADQFLLLRDSKYFSKPRKASKKSFAA